MDTTYLQDVIQVLEAGSIAQVARRNGLTPAAVNLRIKKIENELGVRLVARAGRTVKATAQGAQMLARAKRVMEEVRNLRAASHAPMVFGHLSFGAFDSAMNTLVPGLMARLIARHPNLEVSLVKGYSGQLYSQVCEGELDAALTLRPLFQMPKNMEWRRVRDEALVVLAPAALRGSEPDQLLRAYPLICYDRTLWGGQLADGYFRRNGIRPRIRIETASVELIAQLVAQGLGVSLVPDAIGDIPPGMALCKLDLPGDEYFRSVGVLWNRHSERAPLLGELHGLLVGTDSPQHRPGRQSAGCATART